ncbi:sulfite exporter TauE/SafE family protein [Pseudobacteroides cellulosolvens]|uniref:Probable membrane transporter protein n=1 Tax=Pseudobacteroides cellulosolvens ATCC 35603 = DSM 2933 TaxID=398512 RepID=A0A0L6JP56_9FIRM|nr:sulfite exporter TauE/SafE family protein [Pseudobacteroides cellulosolvens]KNY27564.1 protein of unknown function DUF81 [Pseudobacteroides cellulosolvens ATCC 35603 = DSM 2933]KNY30138.1 protein of unknown function DUF81 [Pseudobacteroides cellulosolvens ATCC 35603 = DSM 2933]
MEKKKSIIMSLVTGTPIGCLGGLIGLGGAEFRLPVLVGIFKKSTHKSVALNLAVSLVTVISSLAFRLPNAKMNNLLPLLTVIISLICGSMTGAYTGAHFSKRVTEASFKKVILVLLVFIGLLLIVEGFYPIASSEVQNYSTALTVIIGVLFGLVIGFISSLLGVAGGELIIPTLIIVFGVDIKIAGTASLLISLPTIIIGIMKHASNGVYSVREDITHLVIPMGISSVIGSFIGTVLVSYISGPFLKLSLGCILIASAVKLFLKNSQR